VVDEWSEPTSPADGAWMFKSCATERPTGDGLEAPQHDRFSVDALEERGRGVASCFAPLVRTLRLFFAFPPVLNLSRSPRSDEHLFKTIRAHVAAKLPPTLRPFQTRSNPTLAQP